MKKFLLPIIALFAALTACGPDNVLTKSGLDDTDFISNDSTCLYTLRNSNGMEVCITNFGARIVSIMVPDRAGSFCDVVLGFDNIKDYQEVPSDFGATIGRYANRIAYGQFMLMGETYQLPKNNGEHCLHGGPQGWQYKVFKATKVSETALTLELNSPDGDMNFPGNVNTSVTFTLTADNKIIMDYAATTDRMTVINMTNHSYFNLNGDASTSATNHVLKISADYFTPADSTLIPYGELVAVDGTPFDFRNPRIVQSAIDDTDYDNQLKFGNGIDHNFVLSTEGDVNKPCAEIFSPTTGIQLTVYTDQPGLQIYSGNFLDGTVKGKNGVIYNQRAAICLETQHYPDSPNKPQWPTTVLNPGEKFASRTVFAFGIHPDD